MIINFWKRVVYKKILMIKAMNDKATTLNGRLKVKFVRKNVANHSKRKLSKSETLLFIKVFRINSNK